ncbi:hypothetical protein [Saccharospirillum salsuginis]|uniref:hypothetical protein n=1 Tax=Saccharospirillum salsuginis TaxID=418750 RepID=UPI0016757846|nr:hypothetical protein [Saccharospirillum salsuginis]
MHDAFFAVNSDFEFFLNQNNNLGGADSGRTHLAVQGGAHVIDSFEEMQEEEAGFVETKVRDRLNRRSAARRGRPGRTRCRVADQGRHTISN